MSGVQDAGAAGEGRRRPEVRHLPPRLCHQGRHPGDAARRGNGRALKILLVRLRLVGDVVFTTPAIRALRRRFPAATLDYVVESAAAADRAAQPAPFDRVRGRSPARPRPPHLRLALARQLRRRRYDVAIDFHGGPRSAWLVRASGAPAANRLRHPGPALGLHHTGALASTPGAAASLGVEPMGSARAARHRPGRPGGRRRGDDRRGRGGRRRPGAA